MEYVLQTRNLSKSYGRNKVLDNVSINVPKGSVYGLVGRNGAGKTTLLRVASGLQKQSQGDCILFGVDSKDKRVLKARRRMGGVIESPAIFLNLSAEDNLKYQASMLGLPQEGLKELLDFVGLGNTGRKKAGKFSLGMKQRLGIAVAMVGSPDFLILDEPTNGLDPEAMVEMRELILRLNREKGYTILISSHILEELEKVATHYGFLDSGRLIKETSAEEMEKKLGKSTSILSDDTKKLSLILSEMGLSYSIMERGYVTIYGEIDMGEIIETMVERKLKILDVEKNNEGLEGYFLSTVGGKR